MASKIPPAELAYQTAHIDEDRGPGLLAFLIVALVISAVSVALRFWSRFIAHARWRADDYTLLAALVYSSVPMKTLSPPTFIPTTGCEDDERRSLTKIRSSSMLKSSPLSCKVYADEKY